MAVFLVRAFGLCMRRLPIQYVFKVLHCFTALLFALPVAHGQTWQFIGGNEGGNIDTLAVDLIDSNVAYATTRSLIFKTVDGGDTWVRLTNAIVDDAIVWDIASSPGNSDVVYAATTRGLYISSNGGVSWNPSFAVPFGPRDILFYPGDPQIVYGASFDNVFKTTDGDMTWEVINNGLSGSDFGNLLVDPNDSKVVYVSNGSKTIFRSIDGGENWATTTGTGLGGSDVTQLLIAADNNQLLYALVNFSDIFKTVDGGSSWTEISLSNQSGGRLVLDPADSSTLFVCNGNGIHRSTDAGLNWALLSPVYTPDGPQTPNPEGGCRKIAIGGSTATMYAEAGSGIRRSGDNGATWLDKNTGLNAANVEQIVVDPQTPSNLYSVTKGGIYQSADSGISWNRVTGFGRISLKQLAVDPQTPTTLYVTKGTTDFKSTDAGANWTVLTPPSGGFIAIDPVTTSTIYVWGGTGKMRKSIDGGANWSQSNAGIENVRNTSMVINPLAPSHLYIGSNSDGFFRSTDAGTTWTPINTGIPDPGSGVFSRRLVTDPFSASTLYASAGNALYQSADNGDTWNPIDTGDIFQSPIGFDHILAVPGPNDQTVLYVNGPDGGSCFCGASGVWRSIDGGLNWSFTGTGLSGSIYTNSGNHLFASLSQAGATVYVGTDRGIFSMQPDLDGDGVPDDHDDFPLDPNESVDTDSDGIGNNADTDDDDDAMPDDYEVAHGLDPLDAADATTDADGDGFTNLEEFQAGTDPQDAADFPGARKVPVAIFIILGDDEN